MMNYVLTIIKYGALAECEVFQERDDALQSAFEYCDMQNFRHEKYHPYDSNKQSWIIADEYEYGYFVSVIARMARDDIYYLSGSSSKLERDLMHNQYAYAKQSINAVSQRHVILDQDLKFFPDYSKISVSAAQPKYYPTHTCYVKPNLLDVAPVNPDPAPPIDVHDDMSHPGGFSLSKGTGLTLQEVWNDPYDAMNIYDMDLHQQYGLAIARVRRRPNIRLAIKDNSFTWSQDEILAELKSKTSYGEEFRDQLMEELADLYRGAFDDQLSEELQ